MALRYRAPRSVRPLAHPSRMGLLRTRLRRFQAAAFLAALLLVGFALVLMDGPAAPAITPSRTLQTATLPLSVRPPAPAAPAPGAPVVPAAAAVPKQAPEPTSRPAPPAPEPVEPQEAPAATGEHGTFFAEGTASYYGRELAGRPTASGERFNPEGMTAAHRTLPLGSRIRVTNPANGESVVVRVNDRGPYHGNRILDLSHGAARAIGIARRGTGRVLIEIIERATGRRSRRGAPAEAPAPTPSPDTVAAPETRPAPAAVPAPASPLPDSTGLRA
jgi:rare lipoprotein A